MDMRSLLGHTLGTILDYKRDSYVHYYGPLNEPNIDSGSGSCELYSKLPLSPVNETPNIPYIIPRVTSFEKFRL